MKYNQLSNNDKKEINSLNHGQPIYVPQSENSGKQISQSLAWDNEKKALPTEQSCPQIVYAPKSVNIYQNYRGTQSVCNGVLQILTGFLCIGFNAGSILFGIKTDFRLAEIVAYGIWGGAIFLVAGSLGIAAGKLKTKCLIISFMAFCILSCCATAFIFSFSIVNIHVASGQGRSSISDLNVVLVVLSVAEAAFGFWGSINCCAVACCCAKSKMLIELNGLRDTVSSLKVYITVTLKPIQHQWTSAHSYLSTSPNQLNQGNAPIIVVDQSFNPNNDKMQQKGYAY